MLFLISGDHFSCVACLTSPTLKTNISHQHCNVMIQYVLIMCENRRMVGRERIHEQMWINTEIYKFIINIKLYFSLYRISLFLYSQEHQKMRCKAAGHSSRMLAVQQSGIDVQYLKISAALNIKEGTIFECSFLNCQLGSIIPQEFSRECCCQVTENTALIYPII